MLRWLVSISRGFRLKLVSVLILSFVSIIMSLYFADYTKFLIDKAVNSNDIAVYFIFGLVCIKLIQIGCEQYETYLREKTKAKLTNSIEKRIFHSIYKSKITEGNHYHTGDHLSRLTNDVEIVSGNISSTIPLLIFAVMQLILTWGYLMTIQPSLTIILGLISPIVLLIGYFYTKLLLPVSRQVRTNASKLNSFIQEHLLFRELVSIMGMTNFVVDKVSNLQNKYLVSQLKKLRISIGMDTITELGFAVGYLCVFIWGIFSIGQNKLNYGEFVVFLQLAGQLQRPVFFIKDLYPDFVSSIASSERLMEIDKLPKEQESELYSDGHFIDYTGIFCDNVSFSYFDSKHNVGTPIISKFTYDFKPGTLNAIVGETGKGKTTLFKLFLAILQPSNGRIIFYKNDSKCVASVVTRKSCVYVPQGNSIISGTIRYNLKLGNLDATDTEMVQALHLASADFVMNEFSEGLDTIVGEKGIGLSEGQAQRISIARGLLQKKPILLLDEPTSALDSETEKEFLSRLKSSSLGLTIIMITHKTKIYDYFDNIVSLNNTNNK